MNTLDFIVRSAVIVGSAVIISSVINRYVNRSQKNESQGNGVCRQGRWRRDKVAWEDIPPELWGQIGKCIESRLDILRFRSMCQQWRSELPYPKRFPVVVPPLPSCAPKFLIKTFLITEVNTYLPFKSRLECLTFEELGHKFRPTVVRPMKARFDYHMISFMESSKHPLFRLSFVAKAYYLRRAVSRFNPHSKRVEWFLQNHKCAHRIVLLCSHETDNVNFSYAKMSDLSVVALMNEGKMRGRLALMRLGGPPENWYWETEFCNQIFAGIATCRGKLCAVDGCGRVFVMDYNSLQMTQVCNSSPVANELEQMKLFEGSGELYLVKLNKTRDKLIVYKLSLQLQQWIRAGGIGSKVLSVIPFLL